MNGAAYGIAALVVSALGTLFAYIANKDKNKNEGANVVIGGYDKLYEDVRSELDRKIDQLHKLQAQYDEVIVQNTKLIDQNSELQKLGEELQAQIKQLTREIEELTSKLEKRNNDQSS